MSKWKPGQLVTLNGKVYRIHKTSYEKSYARCMFCQMQNMKQPCIDMNDYPGTKTCFGILKCMDKMPDGCIPKRI